MMMRRAATGVTRSVFCGLVLLLCAAASAAAQEPVPAAEPQTAAAPADNPVLEFFKRTELSGFVDINYAYNFNTPARPCGTFGTVAVFNCPYNFNVKHNSFDLNLAELAFEKNPTSDSRGGFR